MQCKDKWSHSFAGGICEYCGISQSEISGRSPKKIETPPKLNIKPEIKFPGLSNQQIGKIQYLNEKMKEQKHLILYLKIARQIGINKLEKAIGLTLEDHSIKNPGAYMVAICKDYGFKPRKKSR